MILADLHIHSLYSRATSKSCTPQYLDQWARRKGIGLLGTGDFTHPAWRTMCREQLEEAEDGLYKLRNAYRVQDFPIANAPDPRFVCSAEISTIYKKDGKVRKVHHVILVSGLQEAERLAHRLERVGNLHSDGRPILGLDSHDLLEIVLTCCPQALLIPAHIWTPHFSLFGAFSGFETIEQCYGDLTPHIYALETGLSSDPPMNWQLSQLDGYRLVSNSDAHSPGKLGREANLLEIPYSYAALYRALQTGEGFEGTIEFFPEEGKYHYDGHRNCKLCLTPQQTRELGGHCPVCGKKITIGVQHRVEQLADRAQGYRPDGARPFESLVPLPEVVAASTGRSPSSVRVQARYAHMLQTLGTEFFILRQAPLEAIEREAGPCVREGIRRLRCGDVRRTPGYDGAYGMIDLLDQAEIDALQGQIGLFDSVQKAPKKVARKPIAPIVPVPRTAEKPVTKRVDEEHENVWDALNAQQREAVMAQESAVAVIAGPGTGKTHTLVARIAYLIAEQKIKPAAITAVTFTNQAAKEMRTRLEVLLGGKRALKGMTIGTFHSICLQLLQSGCGPIAVLDPGEALALAEEVVKALGLELSPVQLQEGISRQKNGLAQPDVLPPQAFALYAQRLEERRALDFDDLLLRALALDLPQAARKPFAHLLVDEFQDLNALQHQLIYAWAQGNQSLFVIGDPDQSIYGFRGSDPQCFARLRQHYPALRTISLVQNYRSTPQVLACALPVVECNDGMVRTLHAQRPDGEPVRLYTAQSDLAEGIFIAKEINRMVGGVDMLDAQQFGNASRRTQTRSFAEIAVLYRTHRQARIVEQCLHQEGIPCIVTGREDFLQDPCVRQTLCAFRFMTQPSDTWALQACLCAQKRAQVREVRMLLQPFVQAESMQCLEDRIQSMRTQAPARYHACLDAILALCPRILHDKPIALLQAWQQRVGIARNANLIKLEQMAQLHADMPAFLQTLLLGEEADLRRSERRHYALGTVTLMTLHGAKGLEFPVVFLCGVNAGTLPLETAHGIANVQEERRLFYVGMTRAREELILTATQQPSPFLQQIPQQAMEVSRLQLPCNAQQGKQLSLF